MGKEENMGIERADVICPFYRYDDGYSRLVCEGLTEDSSVIQQYKTKRGFRQQMEIFCLCSCDHCEIFRMLMGAKYME